MLTQKVLCNKYFAVTKTPTPYNLPSPEAATDTSLIPEVFSVCVCVCVCVYTHPSTVKCRTLAPGCLGLDLGSTRNSEPLTKLRFLTCKKGIITESPCKAFGGLNALMHISAWN